jgi:hypothetical protein
VSERWQRAGGDHRVQDPAVAQNAHELGGDGHRDQVAVGGFRELAYQVCVRCLDQIRVLCAAQGGRQEGAFEMYAGQLARLCQLGEYADSLTQRVRGGGDQ